MTKNENELLVKFIVLGESNAGKSSIIECFLNEKFEENIVATLGASFVRKEILVEKKKLTYEIWDTVGQERFRGISKNYYNSAKICLLVYDITSMNSFMEIKNYWLNEVKQNCKEEISIYKI